jgi:hypothetical protein
MTLCRKFPRQRKLRAAFTLIVLLLLGAVASGEKIILIPLDGRPATGQFAQMIGRMAGVDVVMPPYDSLGRFTSPGHSDQILDWLSVQDLSDVSAVIMSSDMVAYGGLIASRQNDCSADLATRRIKRAIFIVRRKPNIKLFIFSATMRLLPTATSKSSRYRWQLGLYEEAKAKSEQTHNQESKLAALHLKTQLPAAEIEAYEGTRKRNQEVQQNLIRLRYQNLFDYLVIGQDDARPFGPHVAETNRMRDLVMNLKIEKDVFFCEGVDQYACVLLSRALLQEAKYEPKIRVIFSDESGKEAYASYESKPIKDSLDDQIVASGASHASSDEPYDYVLYVNTPLRREDRFRDFMANLEGDLDRGLPVALADINLANNGTADSELFSNLWENRRVFKLMSYAGWNTAGNTMGTAIPAANVYLLNKRVLKLAQREFLLHRLVNDFAYHRYTRVEAYEQIAGDEGGSQDEIYGPEYEKINSFVQKDLAYWLNTYFSEQFLDRRFTVDKQDYQISGLDDVKVWLPWPRAYEVRLEFRLKATPVDSPVTTDDQPKSNTN